MFYLTTHSTHFIYGYMASDIWLRTILIVRKKTRCRHIGYSYRLTARVPLYTPPHLQNRFSTTNEMARHTTGTQQRPISADTVRRRLASSNIHCRRPARGPILINRHRQERLQWATARQHWRYQQWRRVLFSDESRFCISTADGRVRVWRRRGDGETHGVGKASWFWETSGSIIKLDLLSFIILAQVEVTASRLCDISIKSFDFTLFPILAVTSITCSRRTMLAPILP